ncbi:hypothetical protein C8J57DRAFT_1235580 [Mycena rebaudengoi]|nr:hypothetical protein C8J57DRAFT_1235580 [Mycena rebaudengoi]
MTERSHTRGSRSDSFRVKEKEASEGAYADPSHGWETEEDVDADVVGDGDGDANRADSTHAQPQPQETTCPLKMCKRWNGGGGGTERLPGRMNDGDKQEAQRTMDRDTPTRKMGPEKANGHDVGTEKDKGKARADALPPPPISS